MGAESFTVLAILEARDRASEIFAKVDESLDRFGETAGKAADTATVAGDKIDESLLKTASGADALDVASARVAAAQEKATRASEAQAEAEKALVGAHKAAAGAADDDVAAQYRLLEAEQRMAAAAKENAAAQKQLSGAQKIQADTAAAAAAKNDEAAAAQAKMAGAGEKSRITLGGVGKAAGIMALGIGVAAGVMVKAAGNFQDSTTHLVTDAGESAKNLAMVQAGILKISTATGTSAADITNAMYHIESAGYHGAAGLKLATAAAEGAKVGGADLDTVSKTLVGAMNAYGLSASHATSFMNQLIVTTGSGDMRMQDLASSLSAVTPLAAAAGIKFSQVGGAIATMTAQGMSANQASQDLANTIRSLSNPNNVAITEMNQLGISSQDVARHLGQRGLTGTIGLLTKAITAHMGKSGEVIMSAFTQSTTAGKDLQVMLKNMPPAFQGMAKGFMDGKVSAKQWRTELQGQTPVNQHLMRQFATLYQKSHSFNSLLASGGPAAQTYTAALAKIMGGATGLNTAMMLSGGRMAEFRANAARIQAAADKGGSAVDNWSTIQGTFNFKASQAKTAIENTGIAIGTALLPAVTSVLSAVTRVLVPVAEWTAKHKKLTEILLGGVTALVATIAVLAGVSKAFKAVTGVVHDVSGAVKGTIGMLKKLAGTSKATAAEQEASSGEAAAAQEADAAEVAAANDEAAAESSGSWATAAGKQIASAAKWVASGAVSAGKVAAGYASAAASAVASWAKTAGSLIAQGAQWVAGIVVKVASVVAANVAGALATAAAWVAANAVMLLGIGLIVAAVAAAVILIVTHWHDIVHGVEVAWHAVYSFISKIIRDVISFVRSHWVLIAGIFLGPVALAAALIFTHFKQIRAFISRAVSDVIGFVRSHWRLIISILGGPLGVAVALVTKYWGDIKHWFTTGVSDVLGILRRLGSDVVSIGGDIVRGLWKGISGAGGWLLNQVKGFASNVLGSIGSFFGIGSPSKYTAYHGQMLGAGLAGGILASIPQVLAAAHRMAGSVLGATTGLGGSAYHATGSTLAPSALAALPAGAAAGGGGTVVNLTINNPHLMTDRDMDVFVHKLGNRLATQILPGAGRKVPF